MQRKRVRMDYDERRAAILAAARRLLAERPISEVSMADFADAGGLLHHYFGSKRELYLAVVRDVVRVPEVPLAEDGDDVWVASVDGWMRLVEGNPALSGGAGRDAEVEAILDESKELVVQRTLEALGLDGIATDELRAVVRAYGAMTEEVTREWLQRERLTREQARTVLLRTLPLLIDQVLPEVGQRTRR